MLPTQSTHDYEPIDAAAEGRDWHPEVVVTANRVVGDTTSMRSTLKPLVALAWPVSVASLLTSLLPTVSLVFVGQLSADAMAAGGLALMFVNVGGVRARPPPVCVADCVCERGLGRRQAAGPCLRRFPPVQTLFFVVANLLHVGLYASPFSSQYSIIQGLLSGMDSLGSQAYGSGNLPRVGLLCQRSMVILAAVMVPVRWACCSPPPPARAPRALWAHCACVRRTRGLPVRNARPPAICAHFACPLCARACV